MNASAASEALARTLLDFDGKRTTALEAFAAAHIAQTRA